MPSILPVLVNAAQFDLSKFASRYLLDCEGEVPVVAYLRLDEDGSSSYITWRAVTKKTGGSIDQLDARAMKELANRPDRPGWDPINIDYQGSEVTILIRNGNYLTGSDVLDPEMLEIVHNYFQADVVHVAVPHTACTIASDSADYIAQHTANEYANAAAGEHEELFCQAYRVENGEIVDVVEFEPPPPPPEFRTIKGKNVLCFITPYNGDFQKLYDRLLETFDAYGPTLAENEHFQGPIVFEIPKESSKFDEEEADTMKKMAEYMTAKAAQEDWRGPNGEEFSVRIRHAGKPAKSSPSEPAEAGGGKSRKRRGRTKSTQMARKRSATVTGASSPGGRVAATPTSKFPYDELKTQIPNKLGWAIVLCRIQYVLGIFSSLISGVAVGLAGREAWHTAGLLGFAVAGVVCAVLTLLIGEYLFVRGLRKCSSIIRTLLIVFAIMGICNPISWIMLMGLLDAGTKQIFDIANGKAPQPQG